jgi:hypothetical protein
MEHDQRVIIRAVCKEGVSAGDIRRHSLEKIFTASGVFGGSAGMFNRRGDLH